jgi:DNA polymerase III delta subunit
LKVLSSNVARFDVFKLSEAVLAGQVARVQRMLDGLQAEGEAAVLVHYTLGRRHSSFETSEGRHGRRTTIAYGSA